MWVALVQAKKHWFPCINEKGKEVLKPITHRKIIFKNAKFNSEITFGICIRKGNLTITDHRDKKSYGRHQWYNVVRPLVGEEAERILENALATPAQ